MAKKTRKTQKTEAQEIKLPEVDVLQTNDAKGLPEAGASVGVLLCCTVVIE